jgi:hypothetical protein
MADRKPGADQEIVEYAGGWITERANTDVPPFLKAAYVVITLGCIAYAILYMNGELAHETRGPFVQQFVDATSTADGLMYFVAGLLGLYAVILWMFAFKKGH